MVLANAAILIVGRALAIPFRDLSGLDPAQIAVLTFTQDATLAVVLIVLLRAWPKIRPAALGFVAPVAARAGLLTGAGLWALSAVIANAQSALVGAHPQSLVLAAAAHRSPEALALDLVFGVGVVAVVEELFFRAVLFTLLRQRMRFAYAAIMSSAIFAAVHEVQAMLPVFALGLGLAILYERRQSLWTNALAHGTVNAISFLLLFFLPDLGG